MKSEWTPEALENLERAAKILAKNKKDCANFPNIETGDSDAKKKALAELLNRVHSGEVDYYSLNNAEQNVVMDDINGAIIEAEKDAKEYTGIRDMGDL